MKSLLKGNGQREQRLQKFAHLSKVFQNKFWHFPRGLLSSKPHVSAQKEKNKKRIRETMWTIFQLPPPPRYEILCNLQTGRVGHCLRSSSLARHSESHTGSRSEKHHGAQNDCTRMFIIWELMSQVHRTSVTQGFLAGTLLCDTRAPS